MGWIGFIVGLIVGALTKSAMGLVLFGALGAYVGKVMSNRQPERNVPHNDFKDTAPEALLTHTAHALQQQVERLEQRVASLEQHLAPREPDGAADLNAAALGHAAPGS